MRRQFIRTLCVALIASSACFLKGKPGDEAPPHDPIPVRVKNENFLDVNVYAIVGSSSRRLGMVTGNSTGNFMLDWSATAGGQPIVMTAIPIGGGGQRATSGSLNVGYGQMIFFTVASVLRQSTASVGDPTPP